MKTGGRSGTLRRSRRPSSRLWRLPRRGTRWRLGARRGAPDAIPTQDRRAIVGDVDHGLAEGAARVIGEASHSVRGIPDEAAVHSPRHDRPVRRHRGRDGEAGRDIRQSPESPEAVDCIEDESLIRLFDPERSTDDRRAIGRRGGGIERRELAPRVSNRLHARRRPPVSGPNSRRAGDLADHGRAIGRDRVDMAESRRARRHAERREGRGARRPRGQARERECDRISQDSLYDRSPIDQASPRPTRDRFGPVNKGGGELSATEIHDACCLTGGVREGMRAPVSTPTRAAHEVARTPRASPAPGGSS
jgi:hypothetical protein